MTMDVDVLRAQFPGLLREEPKGPYVNFIAVRAADREAPWVKTLVESYRTPEVKDFILKTWDGAVLPAW